MWLKDRTQCQTLLWIFFPLTPPSEASLHWSHTAKPGLYHTCPTGRAWWKYNSGPLLALPSTLTLPKAEGRATVPSASPCSRSVTTCPGSPVAGQALGAGRQRRNIAQCGCSAPAQSQAQAQDTPWSSPSSPESSTADQFHRFQCSRITAGWAVSPGLQPADWRSWLSPSVQPLLDSLE